MYAIFLRITENIQILLHKTKQTKKKSQTFVFILSQINLKYPLWKYVNGVRMIVQDEFFSFFNQTELQ